ncbi:MAG: YkuS family protein [Bacillota bacterium]
MKVAVQDNLEEIKSYLSRHGYAVVSPANSLGAAAMIITGENPAGEDEHTYALATNPTITTYAPVINAQGKSPAQVLRDLQEITAGRTGHA